MSERNLRLAIALAVGLVPNLALAQHETHQMPGTQPPSAELTECLRVQPVIDNVIAAAMARAEAARLSNNPTELRAAVEHLEAALRDIRTQSAPCATAAASSDPHAGHTMPGMQAPSSAPGGQAPPESPSSTTAGKPVEAKTADPHAGHSGHTAAQAGNEGDKQMDPVNGVMVDPETAPKTTYQGRTYYFSSEQSRKQFLENPAKFANKPKR